MGAEATLDLLQQGVRVTGTDGWSWDAPFVHTAKRYAATHDATVFHAVPSLMAAWLEYLHTLGAPAVCYPRLRCLLVGGDAVPPSLLAELAAASPTADVVELYGPTEATIISTCFRYPGRAKAPDSHCIGRRCCLR